MQERRHYASKCFKKQRKTSKANRIVEWNEATSGSNTDSNDACEISQIVNYANTRTKRSLRVLTSGQEAFRQPVAATQRDVWDEKQFHKFDKKYGKGTIPLVPHWAYVLIYENDSSHSLLTRNTKTR